VEGERNIDCDGFGTVMAWAIKYKRTLTHSLSQRETLSLQQIDLCKIKQCEITNFDPFAVALIGNVLPLVTDAV